MLGFGLYGYQAPGDNRGGTGDNLPGTGGGNRPLPAEEGTYEMGQIGIGVVHDNHDGQLGISASVPVCLAKW